MNNTLSNAQLVRKLQSLSRAAASLVILIGCIVIAGWIFHIEILKSLLPGLTTMKFNTALGFILAGSGVLTLHTRPRLTQVIASALLLLALSSLSQYLFQWNLNIDEFFVRDLTAAPNTFPGRMSVVTAVNFSLTSGALLLITRRRYGLAQITMIGVAFFSFLVLLGYFYNVEALYGVFIFTSVALHTAVAFVLLSLGLVFAYPDHGIVTIFTFNSAGGYVVRRLLPQVTLIPVIAGWLRWQGELYGLYHTGFGLAFYTLANVVILSAVTIHIARLLHNSDMERISALEALRQANESLEFRVQERTSELAQANVALTAEIASRKQSEANLRESEEQYRGLFNDIEDAIFVYDESANILDVNQNACDRLGYSRDELLHMKITDLEAPEYRHQFTERFQHLIHQRKLLNIEGLHLTRDQRRIPILVNSAVITHKGQVAILAIARDITERKLIEEEIRSKEQLLRTMIDNAPAQIYTKDRLSRFTLANKATVEVLGMESENDVLGKTDFDFHPMEMATKYRSDEVEILTTRQPRINYEEFYLDPKSGEKRWLASSEIPLYDGSGELVGLVGINLDITPLKQMEKQARELEVERERTKMLSDFVRDVSHDFRTPLTLIGTSLFLASKAQEPEKRKLYVERAESQIMRLTQLIEKALAMVYLDSKIELTLLPQDVNRVLIDFFDWLEAEAQKKDIRVARALSDNPLQVPLNREEFKTMMIEIGKNAIMYTPVNGSITVRTLSRDEQVIIEVIDTGVGISDTHLPHIFQRLYRADDARASHVGASGLGLSIANRIAELHHARIEVESTLGTGSTFRIFLPCA